MKINNKGFTLIELLVVISIIGILAGILVLIIDPTQQQNKARNAMIKSSMLKIAYGLNSAKSASGIIPSGSNLGSELSSISVPTNGTGYLNSTFTVNNLTMPVTCAASGAPGDGVATACKFTVYAASGTATEFRIFTEVFDLNTGDTLDNVVYLYSSASGLYECLSTDAALVYSTVTLPSTCTKIE